MRCVTAEDAVPAVQDELDARSSLDPESVAARPGRPRIGYGAHQTFGDLRLDLPGAPTTTPPDYRRELDLDNAVASVVHTHQGVRHQRDFFASAPDGVIVGRLAADRPGSVTFTLRYTSPRSDHTATADDGTLTCPGGVTSGRGRTDVSRWCRHDPDGTTRTSAARTNATRCPNWIW
ncbi:glycoside hydrolase N-terminal domain-containing protein [Streptomyces sp. NPDC001920]